MLSGSTEYGQPVDVVAAFLSRLVPLVLLFDWHDGDAGYGSYGLRSAAYTLLEDLELCELGEPGEAHSLLDRLETADPCSAAT